MTTEPSSRKNLPKSVRSGLAPAQPTTSKTPLPGAAEPLPESAPVEPAPPRAPGGSGDALPQEEVAAGKQEAIDGATARAITAPLSKDQMLALAKLAIVRKQLQRLREDPAGVAVEMPWIQERVKAWEEAKRTGDGVAAGKAYKYVLRGIESEQKRRGIPDDQQAAIPREWAENIARDIHFNTPDRNKWIDRYREALDQHIEYAERTKRQLDPLMPRTLVAAAEHPSRFTGELMWRQAVSGGRSEDFLPDTLRFSRPIDGREFATRVTGLGQVAVAPLAPIVIWLLRERGFSALKSAGWSVAADIIVSAVAGKRPDWQSLLVSALSGGASGFVDLDPIDAWKWEAGMAVLGSLTEDAMKGQEYNYWAAIGAGVGAAMYTRWGKAKVNEVFGELKLGNMSQGVGKVISKAIKEIFAVEVELTAEQAQEFLRGYQRSLESTTEYWVRQFNEWVWQDDRDPLN